MTLNPQLRAILVCPKCRGALTDVPAGPAATAATASTGTEALECATCRLRYPVRDGIPVMLVDEATPFP